MKLSLIRTATAALLAGGMLWPATPASAAVRDHCVGGPGADTLQACET
jgi:hypothetical protein